MNPPHYKVLANRWVHRCDEPDLVRWGTARLLPARVKSGLATSLHRARRVHHVREAAIATDGTSAVLVARWMCGGGSVSAVPVPAEYVPCVRCEDSLGLPEGPAVYRCYADDGGLLYIGSTGSLPQRMRSHKTDSTWWDELAHVEAEVFTTVDAARAAESVAINTERPFYNVDGMLARLGPA